MIQMTKNEEQQLQEWLESKKYLPSFMRDFHEQKNLFKSIHILYQNNEFADLKPTLTESHGYTVDWFLWYMGSRGYTLQKNKTRIKFADFFSWREWRNKND
tara:strand:- start:43 stop:345 length:303 start_codon:yes stop_codon:yes gene_type:complete